jgi:hypothetical protein
MLDKYYINYICDGNTMEMECNTMETRVGQKTVNTKGHLSTVLWYIYLSNLNTFIYNKPYQLYGVDQQTTLSIAWTRLRQNI